MVLARRTALLAAFASALVGSGCLPDPTVSAPAGQPPRVEPTQPPVQAASAARAAALLGGVRAALASADVTPEWRAAATAQCDEQLARFNSIDPFGDPEPVFDVAPQTSADLTEAVWGAVTGMIAASAEADTVAERLLLLSAAAATRGLDDTVALPGEGSSPTYVESIAPQRVAALGHAWALVHALGVGIGRLGRGDELRGELQDRLVTASLLRNALRDGINGPAPSQPAAFPLPTPMTTPEEIREGWAELEVRLVEALVLLAVDENDREHLWVEQVPVAQAAGGRIPRWPGWD